MVMEYDRENSDKKKVISSHQTESRKHDNLRIYVSIYSHTHTLHTLAYVKIKLCEANKIARESQLTR